MSAMGRHLLEQEEKGALEFNEEAREYSPVEPGKNKLQVFVQILRQAGLTEKQIDEAVMALNEYNNARFQEQNGGR